MWKFGKDKLEKAEKKLDALASDVSVKVLNSEIRKKYRIAIIIIQKNRKKLLKKQKETTI